MSLSPEQVVDCRKQNYRAIYQNVPVHAGCIGVGRRREESQYEEKYQERHRYYIDKQTPPAQIELRGKQGLIGTSAPDYTADRADVTGQHGVDLKASDGVEGSCRPEVDKRQGAGEHESEYQRIEGNVPARANCGKPCAEREASVPRECIQLTGACGDECQQSEEEHYRDKDRHCGGSSR